MYVKKPRKQNSRSIYSYNVCYSMTEVIKHTKFKYHLYADDTQLYTSFKPNAINDALSEISKCTADINNWMTCNCLKMNSDKTELMLCGTTCKLKCIDVDCD